MAQVKTILVVDDEPQIVTLVRDYLEHGASRYSRRPTGPPRCGRPPRSTPTSSSSTSACPASMASM
jgi:CheY-like chemotaxis protein